MATASGSAWGTVSCRSNLGRCTSRGVGEAVVGGPATCPNGNQGLELVLIPGTGRTRSLRFGDTGDLLFTELTSETVCYDPSTGTQFKTGTVHITGGTGRFVGATGQLQFGELNGPCTSIRTATASLLRSAPSPGRSSSLTKATASSGRSR